MKKTFILLLTVFFMGKIMACSCNYQGSFLKLAPQTSFIALVKVKQWKNFKTISPGYDVPLCMDVKIVKVYKGTEKRKTITVWGDPGNLCRPYLTSFPVGQYFIIAFSPAGKAGYEPKEDYAINNCGCYWLRVNKKEGTVSGDINANQHLASATWLISDLQKELKKNKQ